MATTTVKPSTRNILATYRKCTESDIKSGIGWYAEARELAAELDSNDIERASAVIAVLSPMLSWKRNVALARQAYAAFHAGANVEELAASLGCLSANANKAANILHGADPYAVVSGNKVTTFWHSIMGTVANMAVIDRHAFDIACGKVTDDKTRGAYLASKANYLKLSDMYVRAARIISKETGLDIAPHMVQAVTWVYWRREHAAANHG